MIDKNNLKFYSVKLIKHTCQVIDEEMYELIAFIPELGCKICVPSDKTMRLADIEIQLKSILISHLKYNDQLDIVIPCEDFPVDCVEFTLVLSDLDMSSLSKQDLQTVRKSVTAPKYLLTLGEIENINFSHIFTESLRERYESEPYTICIPEVLDIDKYIATAEDEELSSEIYAKLIDEFENNNIINNFNWKKVDDCDNILFSRLFLAIPKQYSILWYKNFPNDPTKLFLFVQHLETKQQDVIVLDTSTNIIVLYHCEHQITVLYKYISQQLNPLRLSLINFINS